MEAGFITGSWTLLKPDTSRRYYWQCRCTCGTIKSIRDSSLKSGKSSSCGCVRTQALSLRKTHGMTNSAEYKHWQDLRYRVKHNPKYLDKNIKVCERWQTFGNFYEDMGPRPEGKNVSVERIDNDGDYSPDNCHWGTPKEQNNNKGDTLRITSEHFGTKSLREWTNILNDQTRDTAWTPRTLQKFLSLVTIDELLIVKRITNLTIADFAIEPLELIAA